MLVRGDGVVKLLDFGIAKLLDTDGEAGGPPLTVAGTRVLTPEYAATEQLTGGAIHHSDRRARTGYAPLRPAWRSASRRGRRVGVAPNGNRFRGDLDDILAKALKGAVLSATRQSPLLPTICAAT